VFSSVITIHQRLKEEEKTKRRKYKKKENKVGEKMMKICKEEKKIYKYKFHTLSPSTCFCYSGNYHSLFALL
jgi:hypothetical protein